MQLNGTEKLTPLTEDSWLIIQSLLEPTLVLSLKYMTQFVKPVQLLCDTFSNQYENACVFIR